MIITLPLPPKLRCFGKTRSGVWCAEIHRLTFEYSPIFYSGDQVIEEAVLEKIANLNAELRRSCHKDLWFRLDRSMNANDFMEQILLFILFESDVDAVAYKLQHSTVDTIKISG